MKFFFFPSVAMALLIFSFGASAQCANSATPSCGVYESCFAKLCNCKNTPGEYFISYGKRYCETFLNLPGLSDRGTIWRNSTLRCLQETIVPILPVDGKAETCDCPSIQIAAFDAHVACYTAPGKSICNLPGSDWVLVLNAVGPVASLKDSKSRKQLLEVAKICLPIVASDAKEYVRRIIQVLQK